MFGRFHREFLIKVKPLIQSDRTALPWISLALILIFLPSLTASFWPRWNPAPLFDFLHLSAVFLLPALLLRVPLRLVFLLAWPAVIVAPVAVLCQITTHFLPSEWFFLVLLESNSLEASVFLMQIAGFLFLLAAVVAAYWWILNSKIERDYRAGPLFALFSIVCGVV